uniref:Uncharacterized protein n=1 Tax=viral metagenome TaxID=1070528 RepID=A0A6M3Y006_9ZZZZ
MTEFMEDRLDVIYDEIRDLKAERDNYRSLLEYLLPWVRLHSKTKAEYIERVLAGGKG